MNTEDYKKKVEYLHSIANDAEDSRLTKSDFTELKNLVHEQGYGVIDDVLDFVNAKKAKEEKIRAKSSEFYAEVMDKLSSGANNLRVVRPTGFGKSYLLSKLSYSAVDITGMDRTPQYKNMSLYIYPTTIIKNQMISDYGPNGLRAENRLRGVIFISYSRIGKMIQEFEKGNGYKFCINRVDKFYDSPEDGIYEIDGAKVKKSTWGGIITLENMNDLRKWLEQYIGVLLIDECHKVGSESFRKFWYGVNYMDIGSAKQKKLVINKEDCDFTGTYTRIPNGVFVNRATKTNRKVIGVTATEFRQDGQDPNTIIGNAISKYNLADAIRDGHLQKVDYVYTIGNKEMFSESIIKALNDRQLETDSLHPISWKEEVEIHKLIDSNFSSLGEVIRSNITDNHKPKDNLGRTVDYVKLIVFFDDTVDLKNRHDWIINEFKSAFSDKNINEYIIVSDDNKADIKKPGNNINSNNTSNGLQATSPENMNKYTRPTNGVVDIILCVDVLNMGYHVDDITGVVILRNTESAIVYNQQIGRCFSVKSTTTPLVVDVIDKNAGARLMMQSKGESGYKIDLPELLESNSNDDYSIIDTSEHINKMINKFSFNEYELVDSIYFMYRYRGASFDVLEDMFGISKDKIREYLALLADEVRV